MHDILVQYCQFNAKYEKIVTKRDKMFVYSQNYTLGGKNWCECLSPCVRNAHTASPP